ncbi:2-isopropylmalate synthase [Leptolyngbya sp. Heron Island J]|uniref:2-isopropylmalate synthase n=1 Tax=Leptolyngbya sp. Heron Island J TaxID=1385935 RepID=UPI0003B95BEA|nr:2-isopropylmalate synthase [Leptolyngbya sp. Heron Island J]ESA36429.1 2-isopropylmalate synthase [Leptolyngbya sp. Heron Island J]
MLQNPTQKYRPFQPIQLTDRTWPSRTITQPPVWLSTDLRDGNQALANPMSIDQKLQFFEMLVQIGLKEIEVGFPSASATEFEFVRRLIEEDRIPDDVTIQVLTQARESLIRRTFASLQGAKQAIVHVYNATAPVFRQVVFGNSKAETIELAVSAATLIRQLAQQHPETYWRFQYSPEVFTSTELPFARDICNAVLAVWQPTPETKAVINLPASIEVATPNVFADQVEWMHRHLHYRDAIALSVHPHNDRGCSVAAAELAQMAGADRVEGCLFGNGERTGNVDLVTLAMNLYTQGVHPGLDFSNIDQVATVVKQCTQLPIHPRHPYIGELVFTAFSGSHQDAIKKGFAQGQPSAPWEIPYLPMDPADVGRSYEAIVRVNSQSGKGGIAFLLERDYSVVLPKPLQIEFSQIVQQVMDSTGEEMSSVAIWQLFCRTYGTAPGPLVYKNHHLETAGDNHQVQQLAMEVSYQHQPLHLQGAGNGPIDALVAALRHGGFDIEIVDYEERALNSGSGAEAIALVAVTGQTQSQRYYGMGTHRNITTASILAVLNGVNHWLQAQNSRESGDCFVRISPQKDRFHNQTSEPYQGGELANR